MLKKLWFISEDNDPIAVFDDFDEANDELFYLKEDNPSGNFRLYGLTAAEIDNYSDEFDLAESEGFVLN